MAKKNPIMASPKNSISTSKTAKNKAIINLLNPRKVLYVVLHGLICLIDDNRDQFIADLVDMGTDHKYLCGDFLIEKQIPDCTTLILNGTVDQIPPKSPSNQLDPDKNAVVKIDRVPNIANYYQSRLLLPRPTNINYYIIGTLTKGALQGTTSKLQQLPTYISGIRVFEYAFDDPKSLHLATGAGDIFWDCPNLVTIQNPETSEYLDVAVLHVFNEPLNVLSYAAKHNQDEFNFTLSYLDAEIKLTSTAVVQGDNDDPPTGIVEEELYALDVRETMAKNLMKIIRTQNISADQTLEKIKFAPSKLKQDIMEKTYGAGGGGSGSQVCGGANAIVTP